MITNYYAHELGRIGGTGVDRLDRGQCDACVELNPHQIKAVSSYLEREETYALPSEQKHLHILLGRKVLAPSPHAVAGTLEIMRDRQLRIREELLTTKDTKDHEREERLDVSGEDLIEELFEDEEDSPEPQIDSDEHKVNVSNIGVHPRSSVVQIEKRRAEVDTKTKKRIRDRALERFPPVLRNRKDSHIDFHDLVPCWLTHEWRAA